MIVFYFLCNHTFFQFGDACIIKEYDSCSILIIQQVKMPLMANLYWYQNVVLDYDAFSRYYVEVSQEGLNHANLKSVM